LVSDRPEITASMQTYVDLRCHTVGVRAGVLPFLMFPDPVTPRSLRRLQLIEV
jgi:hypothetical protein